MKPQTRIANALSPPYDASQQPAIKAVESFVQEVKEASPKTKVTVPNYFEAISLD